MKQMFFYMVEMIYIMIFMILILLISVAFITLMERKFLGYIQMRKGPNKLGIGGIFQPFSDAIKLISKEIIFLIKMNYFIYFFSPMLMLMLMLMMWMIYPIYSNLLIMNMGLLYLMCCLSVSVYSFMLMGWSSNSMYSMLGAVRSLAQSISYEVSLAIIMIMPMFILSSMNFMSLYFIQIKYSFMLILWPMMIIFLISMMAELNRTPFDFAEGESELVSGFNIEYMSSGFMLIFLSEYASIIFLSFMLVLLFGNGGIYFCNFMFYLKIMIVIVLVIWIRGALPRFRYDKLMSLCWLMILPFSLNYFLMMIFYKFLMFK